MSISEHEDPASLLEKRIQNGSISVKELVTFLKPLGPDECLRLFGEML